MAGGKQRQTEEKTKRKNLEFIDYCVGYIFLCREEIAPLKTIRIIERTERIGNKKKKASEASSRMRMCWCRKKVLFLLVQSRKV